MTIRTYVTNEAEAKAITEEDRRFVFRNARQHVKKGDRIGFYVMKNGKTVPNKIEDYKYTVTDVTTDVQAPINKGYILISFKEA